MAAAGPSQQAREAVECAPGTRLCLLVTATMGISREVVAGGHRECPGSSSTTDPPRGGVTSWVSWEKGQAGIGNISEWDVTARAGNVPEGPTPMSQSRRGAGPAARQGQ